MCSIVNKIFLSVLLSFGFLSPAFATTEYQLDFKLPQSVKLQLIGNQEDATGYTRRYQVLSMDNNSDSINMLMVTHGRDVKFTPREAMQEVLEVHKHADCILKSARIIKLSNNVIIFRTFLGQCSNGKSADQIYKSFSTPDGQYAINYSADPQFVSQKTIQKMQDVVKTARIIPTR
jgi:hypothetical protein